MYLKKATYQSLKGSSIAEVVTALLIISLSIALTGVLFANVFSSSGRYLRQEAWFAVNECFNVTRLTKDVESMENVMPKFSIEKTSVKVEGVNDLWIVKIEALTSEGKILATRQLMVEVPSDVIKTKE
jgi:hypothetical protein